MLRAELGGEPGGACASSEEKATDGAGITTGASPIIRTKRGVEWSGAFGAESWLPAGTAPLQHSSALDVGRHFPFVQHAAALRVNVPAKQSNGRIRASTARIVTAICMLRRILIKDSI